MQAASGNKSWQMMVGNDDVNAKFRGSSHTFDACNAVVDGDDDVGLMRLSGRIHNGGCQTVSELESIRHDELSLAAHHGQAAHSDRAGRGAVTVVVGNNRDALVALDGVGQKYGGLLCALQRGRGRSAVQSSRRSSEDFTPRAESARAIGRRMPACSSFSLTTLS